MKPEIIPDTIPTNMQRSFRGNIIYPSAIPLKKDHRVSWEAYDHFVGWTKANRERLRTMTHIDWSEVFSETNYDNRHLARYYVKNMCCRIVDGGADVPKQLVRFLDDLEAEPPLGVIIYRDYGPDEETSDGVLSDPFASRTSQASGDLFDNTNEPNAFFTIVEDGFIGSLVGYYAPPHRPVSQECISRGTWSRIYEAKRELMWAAPLFKDKWFLEHCIQEKLGTLYSGKTKTRPYSF